MNANVQGTRKVVRLRKQRVLLSMVAASVAVILAACGSGSGDAGTSGSEGSGKPASGSSSPAVPFPTVSGGELTVAYSQAPPDFLKDSGSEEVTGTVPSILDEFAKKNKIKIKYTEYSFAGALTAVQTGRADLGASAYFTEERAKYLYFPAPYNASGTYLITKKGAGYAGVDSLKGKKMGVATGFEQVKYMQKALGNKNVLQFASDPAAIQAVKTGRIYGFVSGVDLIYLAARDDSVESFAFKAGELGFPQSLIDQYSNMYVSCKNKPLGKALNETIAELRASGQLAQIVEEHLNDLAVVKEQKEWPDMCST